MHTESYQQTSEYPRGVRQSPRAPQIRPVYTTFGIRVDDAEVARLVSAVMAISTWMSLLALASALFALFSGWWFTIGIVPAVLIPCCGYAGAA